MQVNIGFFAQYRILCKCHDGARCRSATKRLNIFPASPHRDAPSSHPGCKLPGLNGRATGIGTLNARTGSKQAMIDSPNGCTRRSLSDWCAGPCDWRLNWKLPQLSGFSRGCAGVDSSDDLFPWYLRKYDNPRVKVL